LAGNAEDSIRVQASVPIDSPDRASTKQTEWTYALMVHFSQSLGVNCTFCHNSRAWSDWSQSPAKRATAWYGIRMVRELNHRYVEPLGEVLPAARLGPTGMPLADKCIAAEPKSPACRSTSCSPPRTDDRVEGPD